MCTLQNFVNSKILHRTLGFRYLKKSCVEISDYLKLPK